MQDGRFPLLQRCTTGCSIDQAHEYTSFLVVCAMTRGGVLLTFARMFIDMYMLWMELMTANVHRVAAMDPATRATHEAWAQDRRGRMSVWPDALIGKNIRTRVEERDEAQQLRFDSLVRQMSFDHVELDKPEFATWTLPRPAGEQPQDLLYAWRNMLGSQTKQLKERIADITPEVMALYPDDPLHHALIEGEMETLEELVEFAEEFEVQINPLLIPLYY